MKKNIKKVVKSDSQKIITPKQPSIKIGPDTTCVFTVYEPGAFKARLKKNEKIPIVRKRTVLNNTCLKYFISEEAKPKTFTGFWKNASKKVRLEANLEYMADGKKYTYELID